MRDTYERDIEKLRIEHDLLNQIRKIVIDYFHSQVQCIENSHRNEEAKVRNIQYIQFLNHLDFQDNQLKSDLLEINKTIFDIWSANKEDNLDDI